MLTFPVAFIYVMGYVLILFLRLFLTGNHVEYIIQIIFVTIQNKLDKLVYRAAWFTPFVYIALILKLYFLFKHN